MESPYFNLSDSEQTVMTHEMAVVIALSEVNAPVVAGS
jgi:hypothetical protein